MIKLNPNVRFSYKLTRGTNESRRQLVSKLNEKFFDSFYVMMQNGKVRLNDLKKVYAEILPENKKVDIKKLKNNTFAYGASDFVYDDNDNIIGLTLELPLERGVLTSKILPTLMHETTHVLSTLANPKQTALTQKLHLAGKFSGFYNKWFSDFLYCKEDINDNYTLKDMRERVLKGTKKLFSGMSIKDKIAYLQDARYQLEEEKDAFREQLKFAKKIVDLGGDVEKEDLLDEDKTFRISEKIDILKELLSDVLEKRHKKNLEKYGHFVSYRL